MHPTMDPHHEMRLWPHDSGEIYAAFDRIFDCSGHGWANLQSVHLNVPFADDSQFAPLHAAVRLLLPLLPALAASSPIAEGRVTGLADTRLDAYGANARRIPSVSGSVVPEPAFSRADYEQSILQVIYRDMAAHDPHGILRYEWVNARGAIARFDRNTIEIRLLDMQECPLADVAICAAVVEVLRVLSHGRWTDPLQQQNMPTEPLAEVLRATIAQGDRAAIRDQSLLQHFGVEKSEPITAGDLWRHLIQQVGLLDDPTAPWRKPLSVMLNQGPLSRRITDALGTDASRQHIDAVYRRLCDCLASGAMFTGA
jgi:gamma-glutamyl:cysteine ligase YbdK (ATP-grasp superfamily)